MSLMDGSASTAFLIYVGRQFTIHEQAAMHRGASHLIHFEREPAALSPLAAFAAEL